MARMPKAKAGYQFVPDAVNPKTGRKYADPRSIVREVSSGKLIPRREYIKRTEGIPSLEYKARGNARRRLVKGIRDPQKQYKAAADAWRKTRGTSARVRGSSSEAVEFQELYARLKNLYARGKMKKKWGKREKREYLEIQYRFGLLTKAEFQDLLQDYGMRG
jgi:hypothetical protein